MSLAPVVLTGPAVRLEPLAPAHYPDLERHGDHADVWRWMTMPPSAPVGAVRAWCATVSDLRTRGEALPFAIIEPGRGEAVGGTVLFDYSAAHRRVEIGYTWLSPAVWRTAVNTGAKYLLLRHAFETLGLNRVQLKTDSRNTRSQAAIARLGAVREGVWRSHMVLPDGYVRDSVLFSVIAAEWPAVKAGLEAKLARA